jgi:ParB/RepB/Spo0J family partition protein
MSDFISTQSGIEVQNVNNNNSTQEEAMTAAVNTQAETAIPNTNPIIIDVPMDKLAVPTSHPRRNIGDLETLQKSIRKNGLLEPLTVCKSDEDDFYMVIDGTRRLTALIEFGWKAVPCIQVKSMSLGEIAHFAFEKNMERRSLSPIEIALHLKSMHENNDYSLRDLEALGYGSPAKISQQIRLLDLPAKVKDMIENSELTMTHGIELGKLPKAKTQESMAKRAVDFGWTAKRMKLAVEKFLEKGKKPPKDRVKIPEGDIPGVCFKDAKDMSELPDDSAHLIVTSPPYWVGMEYEKGVTINDHWDNVQGVMDESARVLVPGGIMAVNVGDIHNYKGPDGKNKQAQILLVGQKYQSFLRRHKVYLSDIIIWVKRTQALSLDPSRGWSEETHHTGYRMLLSHEPVYIFRKAGDREVPSEEVVLNSRITRQEWDQWINGVWTINTVRKDVGHPAIFPDELVNRLVRMFSYEGDTVLDPFLGSGTTIKVARELGREAFGYERETQYKPVIMEKLGLASGDLQQTSMIGYAEKVMDLDALEQESVKAEAEAASKQFEDETEVAEPETVE